MIDKLKIRLSKDTFESLTYSADFTAEQVISAAIDDAAVELSGEVKNGSQSYQADPEYQTALVFMTIAVLYDRQKKDDGKNDREKALRIMRNKYESAISCGEFFQIESEEASE